MKAPCLNCRKRKIGCHDRCGGYQSYKANLKTRDKDEIEYVAYLIDTMRRFKRCSNG